MTTPELSPLKRAIRLIHSVEDSLLAGILGAMVLLATLQIVLRNVFDSGILWGDPLLKVMVIWLGLLGALSATRENKHISVDVLTKLAPKRLLPFFGMINNAFAALVCGFIAWHSLRLVQMDKESPMAVVGNIPNWLLETILPLAFGLMTLRFTLHLAEHALGLLREKKA